MSNRDLTPKFSPNQRDYHLEQQAIAAGLTYHEVNCTYSELLAMDRQGEQELQEIRSAAIKIGIHPNNRAFKDGDQEDVVAFDTKVQSIMYSYPAVRDLDHLFDIVRHPVRRKTVSQRWSEAIDRTLSASKEPQGDDSDLPF